jgi:Leucine-rich repeat (LRR) protein
MWDLHLGQNKLTGTIPATIGSISSLNTLDLAGNGNDGRIGIRGSIPSELGKCQNLYYLFLDNNTLAESIPSELGSIPALQYLFVARNGLTGTIPVELGNTPLTQMDLQSNYLTGDIGPVIDSFPRSLELFVVGGNKLRGTIPTSIGSFSSLVAIDFGRNDMNGTIPSQFGELPSLEALRLGENKFVGTLPMSIASLPNLCKLTEDAPSFDMTKYAHLCHLCSAFARLWKRLDWKFGRVLHRLERSFWPEELSSQYVRRKRNRMPLLQSMLQCRHF